MQPHARLSQRVIPIAARICVIIPVMEPAAVCSAATADVAPLVAASPTCVAKGWSGPRNGSKRASKLPISLAKAVAVVGSTVLNSVLMVVRTEVTKVVAVWTAAVTACTSGAVRFVAPLIVVFAMVAIAKPSSAVMLEISAVIALMTGVWSAAVLLTALRIAARSAVTMALTDPKVVLRLVRLILILSGSCLASKVASKVGREATWLLRPRATMATVLKNFITASRWVAYR